MHAAYFDASAIAKLLLDEPESLALLDYLEDDIRASTSAVCLGEIVRAIRRHGLKQEDDPEGTLNAFVVLDVTRPILLKAGRLEPIGLRTLDAIHLATALSIADPHLEFVTYDDRLATAAAAHGFKVVQPGIVRKSRSPR